MCVVLPALPPALRLALSAFHSAGDISCGSAVARSLFFFVVVVVVVVAAFSATAPALLISLISLANAADAFSAA
jgi:hypothetical protein